MTDGLPTPPDITLEASQLTKSFGGFIAVDQVDLRVRRGSIHGLIGPNGAGKTTCFNLLTKVHTPTAGRILFNGQDITKVGTAEIAERGLVEASRSPPPFPTSQCSRTSGSRCSAGGAGAMISGDRSASWMPSPRKP